MGSLVSGLIVTALPRLLPLLPKKIPLHGNACWTNSREIREAGLFSDDSIIVCVTKGFMGLYSTLCFLPALNTF